MILAMMYYQCSIIYYLQNEMEVQWFNAFERVSVLASQYWAKSDFSLLAGHGGNWPCNGCPPLTRGRREGLWSIYAKGGYLCQVNYLLVVYYVNCGTSTCVTFLHFEESLFVMVAIPASTGNFKVIPYITRILLDSPCTFYSRV